MKRYENGSEIEEILKQKGTNTKECEDYMGFHMYMLEENTYGEITIIGWYNGQPRRVELNSIIGDIQRRTA